MPFTTVFTSIPNGDIDVDSPITTSLMTAYRNNDQYLLEYIGGGTGGGFTPQAAHNHDGVNSASILGQVLDSNFAINTSGGTTPSFSWNTINQLAGVSVAAGEALFVDVSFAGQVSRTTFIVSTETTVYTQFRLVLGGLVQNFPIKANTARTGVTNPQNITTYGYFSGSARLMGNASGQLQLQVQANFGGAGGIEYDESSIRFFKITT